MYELPTSVAPDFTYCLMGTVPTQAKLRKRTGSAIKTAEEYTPTVHAPNEKKRSFFFSMAAL